MDLADKLGAKKIKKSALEFLANNFELFSTPKNVGQESSLARGLASLPQEVLVEIITVKAEVEYKDKYM